MQNLKRRWDGPFWLIVTGGIVFMLMLAASAVMEADLRWLHFFQAWMYLAPIVLAARKSKWGYFIGISAAGLWDYVNLFVTTFFVEGLHAVGQWIHTGSLERPDLAIGVLAWTGNLVVVLGCLWGYFRLADRTRTDLARFVVCFAATTGFLALDMALFQPRYLELFPRLLHPHWP